jgi:hypothetical protein
VLGTGVAVTLGDGIAVMLGDGAPLTLETSTGGGVETVDSDGF